MTMTLEELAGVAARGRTSHHARVGRRLPHGLQLCTTVGQGVAYDVVVVGAAQQIVLEGN